jgi:hypothetical protein
MEEKTLSRIQAAETASDLRSRLVKQQVEAERVAADAKTAKLRALRLAKEAADLASAPPAPAPKPKRKPAR